MSINVYVSFTWTILQPDRSGINSTMVKDSVPASEISCNEGNGKGKTLSWTDKLVEAFDASSGVNIYSEEQAL